jgi:hypothetical protein
MLAIGCNFGIIFQHLKQSAALEARGLPVPEAQRKAPGLSLRVVQGLVNVVTGGETARNIRKPDADGFFTPGVFRRWPRNGS